MKFSYLTRVCGLIIVCVVTLSGTAMASGIGFYVQGGGGSAKWEADDLSGQFDFESDAGHAGLGFVFDSNVSRNSLFNYRASLGYEKAVHDPDNGFGDIKLDSIVLDQDFGFGVYRSSKMRVWVGPELRISYSSGKPDDARNLEYKLWGLGVGPVAGINFHVSRIVSLGLKGGILAIGYSGKMEDNSNTIDDQDYAMGQSYAFFNFAVIFRLNDQYEVKKPSQD